MKKLLLSASAVALVACMAGKANAECDGIYGAIRAGIAKHDIEKIQGDLDKNRLMLSGALGYRWEYFRTELEYVWRKYATDTREDNDLFYKTYSYMWNVYYDVLPYNWWSPYVNAGIGLTKMRFYERDDFGMNADWSTSRFTWSLGAGLSLKVTNRLNIDAGYRYYDMGAIRHMDVDAHEIYGGLRYVF